MVQEQEFRDSSYIGFSRKSKCYSMRELTKGSPAKVIMTFALPIIFGNLLQQLYNLADGKIVSTYVGTQAFAAVGATAVIANLIIGFVNGVTQGFGIPISRCFGAGDYKNMRRYVAGSFIMTVAMTLILTVGALLGIEGLLHILDTPADIMEEALQYIRIIIMGTAFISLYNYSANILRAIGESRIPLLCLAVAVILNIFLDILFVHTFSMGLRGAAHATNIAQCIAGVLCMAYLLFRFRELVPKGQEWQMQRRKYQEMTIFGISLGMMSCFVSIGTVIFQTAVNRLGTKIVTAHIAARRIEELTNVPMLCTGMAMTTYASQNLGAGEYDRIKKGIHQAFVIVLVQGVIFTTFCWIFGHPLIRWITRNTSFYFVLGPLFVLRCSLQGLEHKVIPVASSILELVLKIVSTIWIVPVLGYTGVIYTEPIIWIFMTLMLIGGYVRALKQINEAEHIKSARNAKAENEKINVDNRL
mgnify:CR=1 FL=1